MCSESAGKNPVPHRPKQAHKALVFALALPMKFCYRCIRMIEKGEMAE